MNFIDKCFDCDRWKHKHRRSTFISEEDLICKMCQASVLLSEQNDMLEESLVYIRSERVQD